jgi:hypothetical protein
MIYRGRSGSGVFSYDRAFPEKGTILLYPQPAQETVEPVETGVPATIVVAGEHGVEHFAHPSADHPRMGVLVDLVNARVLVGSPSFVRSTFVFLFYLDGRYSEHFEKFDERTTFTGDRLVTWKVDWQGQRSRSRRRAS